MIEIDIVNEESLPLTEQEFIDVIQQVLESADTGDLNKNESKKVTNIFDSKTVGTLEGGFEITTNVFRDAEEKLGVELLKFIIFEDDDEWLDAFSVITKKKSKQ